MAQYYLSYGKATSLPKDYHIRQKPIERMHVKFHHISQLGTNDANDNPSFLMLIQLLPQKEEWQATRFILDLAIKSRISNTTVKVTE